MSENFRCQPQHGVYCELVDRLTAELTAVKEQLEQVKAEAAEYRTALGAVEVLMDNSTGVAGLHLNGDVATWGDLRTGGRFESWLIQFDEALKGKEDA